MTDSAAPELLETVRRALADPHPLALLLMGSTIIVSLDPERGRAPEELPRSVLGGAALHDFCQSLLHVGSIESLSLASVIGDIAGDDVLRARIRRELATRKQPVPGWVRRLDQMRVAGAIAMTDVLGDGQNIVVEAQLPDNHSISVLSYVDHNQGTLVKDAFVIPETLSTVWDAWDRAHRSQPHLGTGSTTITMSLADARARLTEAIEEGHRVDEPFETESWPACEPLLLWLLRSMPVGGEGYPYVEAESDYIAALAADFLNSPWGEQFVTVEQNDLVEWFLIFAATTAEGDPLRWSMVNVELLMMHWLVQVSDADPATFGEVPNLLRAVVRFSHNERRIPPALTRETLEAIDRWEPPFRALISQLGLSGHGDDDEQEMSLEEYYEYLLEVLAEEVGGPDVLNSLDTDPLRPEPFDWTGVSDDIVPRVTAVLDELHAGLHEVFSENIVAELSVAAHRFVARVAAADPAIFRRKSSNKTAAATIAWVLASVNRDLGRRVLAKDLLAAFGVSGSVSGRADPMLRAVGARRAHQSMGLNDVSLLTSDGRRRIIAERDELLAGPSAFAGLAT